ncbi:MAG: HAMP domain-containing sensor histidine kinase [Leptospiraceae bacterium]|nr:HAMP domain-containing sensor histidine kinase [Leptospiraceae bacterium]
MENSEQIYSKLIELESIIDSIYEPILLIDKSYRISRANKVTLEFAESQGYSEILGKPCYEILFERKKPCEFCPIRVDDNSLEPDLKKLNSLSPPEQNFQVLMKIMGKSEELDLTLFPMIGELNEKYFVEKISIITKVKEKEEENLRFRKLASLGTMVSGIAHELNNPLTGISLTLQNLKSNIGKYDLRFILQRLDIINDDLQKASNIVSDIMSFARQEKIKVTYSSIVESIQKARLTVERLYPALCESVVWEFICEEDILFYYNSEKIERLLINLFRNSLQAIDYRNGKISIEIKKKKNNCQLIIQDNGGGISKEISDKIFDPFFTNKKNGEGTGLGLSISHSIVQEHGGRIQVKSFDDKTRFIISLPMERANG